MTPLALLADPTVRIVALGAALLGAVGGVAGAFAVLRRQSLLGDTLAHAALPGVCIGFLVAGGRSLPALMAGALVAGLLAAGVVALLARTRRIKPDAALGIVLSLFFALGVVLLTHIQNGAGASQAGLETFLFGQAAAMRPADVTLIAGIGAVVLAFVVMMWRDLALYTFDPDFARAQGRPVVVLDLGLTGLIALAVVAGVQMVGVVLMTALLVAPAASARQWVRRLAPMVALSALFGAVSGVTGALVSAGARGLATGPLIVLAATALVIASFLFAPERGMVAEALRSRATRRKVAGQRVLDSLAALARDHADPAYPAERGMIEALHGPGSARALSRLEEAGLIRSVTHAPEPTAHWELTAKGRASTEGRAE